MTDQPQTTQRFLPPNVPILHFDAVVVSHTGTQCFIEFCQYDWTAHPDTRPADTAAPATVVARFALPPLQAQILQENVNTACLGYVKSGLMRSGQPNLRSVP